MASVDTCSFALCSHKPNDAKGKPKLNNGKPRTGQYRPSSGRPTYGQQHGARYSQPNGSPRPSSGPRPSYSPATSSHPGKSGPVPSITDTSIPVPCQICGKNYHNALDCFHRMDYAYQGQHPPSELAAMVSQCNTLHDEDDWLADSVANNHDTAELENLTIQEPYQGTESVAVGNGNGLSILHTGSSTLHTPKSILHLKEILHCPEASANLLSINKFCRDNNCWFKLTDTYFLVKDNLTGEILLQGPSENGLYLVQLQSFIKNKREQGRVALLGVKTSSSVWHKRLGHPHDQILSCVLKSQLLLVSLSQRQLSLCLPCQVAKSRQLPFLHSQHVTTSPLELLHSDIWCSPVSSLSGCNYYVVFVDDFSRYSWFFPLIHKSEVLGCFIKLKCLLENQFSSKIMKLQTDGGGEYTSHAFTNFLSNHGIFHRISCPHTSQQHGIAERKHRHIVETGPTLLAQSHLPSKFWVETFSTAVYLINGLPTPTLIFQTPYHKLFHSHPNYTFIKVFGCAAYPLLRPYIKHKLEFRSKQCIFIGYSSNHKGYRCLDPTTNRVYISRNVVFDESLFPALGKGPVSHPASIPSSATGTLLPSHFFIANGLDSPLGNSGTHLPISATHVPPITSPFLIRNSTHVSSPTSTISPPSPASPLPTCEASTSNLVTCAPVTSPIEVVLVNSPSDCPSSPTDIASPSDCPTPTYIATDIAAVETAISAPSLPETDESLLTLLPVLSHSPFPHIVTRSKTGSLKSKEFPDYQKPEMIHLQPSLNFHTTPLTCVWVLYIHMCVGPIHVGPTHM
jgi:hypothetical protein